MANTPQKQSDLLTSFADNTGGLINAQDMRNYVVSIPNLAAQLFYNYGSGTTPSSGQVYYAANHVYINKTDGNGVDQSAVLNAIAISGSIITVRDLSAAGVLVTGNISAASLASSVYNLTISNTITAGSFTLDDFAGVSLIANAGGGSLATPVTVANGGTGLATLTAHAVVLGEGTSNVAFATIGTSGRLLIDQGSGADPSFAAMSGDATISNTGALALASTGTAGTYGQVTTDTKGRVTAGATCDAAHGGTGLATLTSHAVVLGAGTSNVGFATIGTSGRLLIDQGAGADPSFAAMSGDATITNTGVITVANNAITTAKVNNGAITEAKQTLADNTTCNVSTTAHGYAPKLPNDATKYMDGTGAYTVPAGSGGGASAAFSYNFTTSSTPSSGQIYSDYSSVVKVHTTDANSVDQSNIFSVIFLTNSLLTIMKSGSGADIFVVTGASLTSSVYSISVTRLGSTHTFTGGDAVVLAIGDNTLPPQAGHTNAILRTDASNAAWCDNFTVASNGNSECHGTMLVDGAVSCLAGLSISIGNLVVQIGNVLIGGSLSVANGALTVDVSGNLYTPVNANVGSLTGPSDILPLKSAGSVAAALQFLERGSDPGAPASANGILYLRDDGSGKAQLCMQFPTGSPVVICTEA